jgi:anti-sigma B factor antagonist
MRFETRTSGVFEVLGVHLDADQTFDAGRLRQETLRLVEKGSRRIVVDLGQIDYLYSDSINAFVALNRRMLESSGRLGILVPHAKVHEILVRAGLENIMRLYRTEAELLGDSRELMRQSSAWTRPAELSSAASASQILSATNLIPRSGEPSREGASTQRIPRRHSGPRVELKTRRRDGRRQEQTSRDDAPLPPPLPGVGSESSSLRALSRESSSFGPPTPRTDWSPPPRTPAPVLPSAEPTVFQLPQDPEQDGYSTDAWLLALTNQPVTEGRRREAEQDSSSFLPKLANEVAPPAPAVEDNPPSQLDTGLRWEEEIPLTDGPARTAPARPAPTVAEPPTPPVRFGESPFASAFLDSPPAGGTAAKPACGRCEPERRPARGDLPWNARPARIVPTTSGREVPAQGRRRQVWSPWNRPS